MGHPFTMLELEEAIARILGATPPPTVESVPLTDAHGRILLEPLRSPVNLPVFDNSAMDGYAVRAVDVAGATPNSPARLRVAGRVAAGEAFSGALPPHSCVRLFTGSPLPTGADAVVTQEDTRVPAETPGEVLVLSAVQPEENVRFKGEDIRQGAALASPGERLSARRIGLLAATGFERVRVGRQPVAGLLATGSELREAGQELGPGQIYESNRVAVAALARLAGAVPRIYPIVADSLAATESMLRQALAECDVVVSSGGVSVGEMDFVKQALASVGGELDYWKVNVKPGRPFVFGRLRGKLFFGLPGNPISALVAFLLLVRPALLRGQGATDVELPAQAGVLAEPLSNPGERRHFMRVRIDADQKVFSGGLQASHALSSAAAANGLVDVPPGAVLATGTTVQVKRWE